MNSIEFQFSSPLFDLVDGEKSPKYSVLPEPNPSCVQVETFFLPFELACQSKTSKIVCSALDSIEKLVAYGHISYQHFGDDSDYAIYDTGLTKCPRGKYMIPS